MLSLGRVEEEGEGEENQTSCICKVLGLWEMKTKKQQNMNVFNLGVEYVDVHLIFCAFLLLA